MRKAELAKVYEEIAQRYVECLLERPGQFLAELAIGAAEQGMRMEIDNRTLEVTLTDYHPLEMVV